MLLCRVLFTLACALGVPLVGQYGTGSCAAAVSCYLKKSN